MKPSVTSSAPDAMSPVSRRVVTSLMIAYLAALAVTVFSPTSRVQSSAVQWMHGNLQGLGVPYWVSASTVEFASNVVLFIPLSLLGSLLWQRWGAWAWTLAGFVTTLTIEAAQMVFLSGRSPTVSDIVANTLGAFCGALLALPVRSRLRRRHDDAAAADHEEQSS